ncbi:MAG: suppressor of fused domain protein, partial [Acidimicrobiales bacterium]
EAEVERRLKNWGFEQMNIEEGRGGPFGGEGQRQPGTGLWRLPVASHRALTPEAPGWDAIDAALARLVGETVPTYWASGMTDFRWGVRGISAYPRQGHWLLVTYGLSTLYVGSGVTSAGIGFGEELTIRVQARDTEEGPPGWAVRLLEVLGQLVYQRSAPLLPGAKSSVHADDGPASLLAFTEDPELPALETDLGPVQFVAVVPVSSPTYQQMRTSSVNAVIDELRSRDPLLVVESRAG